MTAILSAMWRTTARSWATNRYESPSRARSSSSRLMTPAWIETSSAETGSPRKSGPGSRARARARPLRGGEPPRDPDALALPARELLRIARGVLGIQADEPQQLADPRADLLLLDALRSHRLGGGGGCRAGAGGG